MQGVRATTNRRVLVGITGGIGAGKSTVLAIMARLGFPVLDADEAVHRLYESDSELVARLVERWGAGVLDAGGALDRRAVAERVFQNPGERRWLNRIVHPRVRARIREFAEQSRGLCFCGVPLLYEVGWEQDFDRVAAVWCDPETQWRRLRRRGWSPAEIRRRIASQLSMDAKLERADFGIVNTGPRRLLEQQCARIARRLRAASRSG